MANEVIEGFRPSPQQSRLWALQRNNPAYNARSAVLVEGPLDRAALRDAIQRLVNRHEILRTNFQGFAEWRVPLQVIAERCDFRLKEIDLSRLDAAEQTARVEEAFAEEGRRPFETERGPVLRATLFRLDALKSVLLFCLSPMCADAMTLSNLFVEIGGAYAAVIAGEGSPAEPIQYVQISEWLNELSEDRKQGEPLEGQRREDAGEGGEDMMLAAALTLPCERQSALTTDFRPASLALAVEPSLARRAESLAERHTCADASFWAACWQILLWRLTGREAIILGHTCDGRRYEELSGALGLFARCVPLGCAFAGDYHFDELLEAVNGSLAGAEAAWEDFKRETGDGGRDASSAAFFHACFEYVERPARQQSAGLVFSLTKQFSCPDRFKLKLLCVRTDEGLTLEFQYDAVSLDAATVERFARHLLTLAEGVVAEPSRPVRDYALLSDEDRRLLLQTFNETRADYPRERCLHELIEEQAARTPERVAVVFGEESLTFAELDASASRLARRLRSLGVGPEVRVGVCVERSLKMMVALVGVLKAGGAYVALSPSDPFERLRFMLTDAGVPVLLTQTSMLDALPQVAAKVIDLDAEWEEIGKESASQRERDESASRREHDEPAPQHESATQSAREVTPDNLAYVLYTSGSTGQPKGVMVTQRGLVNYLHWCVNFYEVTGGEGAPVHSPVTFDLTVTSLFAPLLAGRKVLLLPEEQGVEALAAALAGNKNFSLVKLTPAHLEVLAQQLDGAQVAESSRVLVIGGEALLAESLELFRRHAPRTRLINEYGPTETVVGCCIYEVPPEFPSTGPVAIGRPIANTQLFILDSRMEPVAIGVPGELYIGGDGLARGYLNRPELTAERFTPDPFGTASGARLYRTGDLARYLPDGQIEYLGRTDDQVKVRGYRIELGEIEAVLRRHEAVREASVVVREDEPGEKMVVGYVVADRRETPAPEELRRFLQERLPEYMIPARFVSLDTLPLTRGGKVDRRALPAPGPAGSELKTQFAPPRTMVESVMAAVWSEVLRVERVGIDDNFFALGGDSIRSIQVRARAQERGLSISHQQLFQHQTIRELAGRLKFEDGDAPRAPRTEPFGLITEADRLKLPLGIEDAYPLTRLQAGMLFHSELRPDTAVFHDLHSFRMKCRLDTGKLRSALQDFVSAHPLLRTSFDLNNYSEPLQLVHESVSVPFEVEDLSHLRGEAQDEAVASRLEEEKGLGFDWNVAPLLRFRVQLRAEDEFQFVFSFHHSVLDGWSVASLLTELFNRYAAMLDGDVQELKPLDLSFRDYIALERAALESEEHRRYWNELLEGATLRKLPRRPPSSRPSEPAAGNVVNVPISQELSDGLRRVAQEAAVPLKSVLLAAHLKVMSLLGGESDVLTALISNGRPEDPDGDRVLGLFLNALPFRLNLRGGSWHDLVRATFEAERRQLPFRRYPLAELQRSRGGGPLFETAFNFMHFHVYQNIAQDENVELLEYIGFEETDFPIMANFSAEPNTSQLDLNLNFRHDAIDAEQIAAIAEYYRQALLSLANEPHRLHHTVCLLSEQEQRQLLREWNETASDYPHDTSYASLFSAQARLSPNLLALSSSDGSHLTYAQLDELSTRLALRLRSLGIGSESLLALLMPRGIDFVTCILSAFKAGAAYLPLDPQHPPLRLSQVIGDARPQLLITSGGMEEAARHSASLLDSETVEVHTLDQLLRESDVAGLADELSLPPSLPLSLPPSSIHSPEQLAYVIYTSGSTGSPKGAMLNSRGLLNHLFAKLRLLELTPSDLVAQSAPQSFDISIWQMLSPLLAGAGCRVLSDEVTHDPAALLCEVEESAITILEVVPSMLRAMLEVEPAPALTSLSSLRYLLVTGEALPPELARRWMERYPSVRLVNAYGPTECSDDVTHHILSVSPDEDATRVQIGRAVENTRLYVLDREMGLVPEGVAGELYVGGDGVGRGYLNRAEMTAERFVPDPFGGGEGARLYRTGDVVRYVGGGELEFLGRADGQVKVRGQRIELGEVEAVVGGHEGVRTCAVMARGEGERRRLVAYVELREDKMGGGGRAGVVEEERARVMGELRASIVGEVRAYVRERLPEYMTPTQYVVVEEMPLTVAGKVDRRRLEAMGEGEAGEWEGGESEAEYEEPETETEREVAEVFSEVLGVRRVGRGGNFFEMGGHSLLATQVASRMRMRMGVEIALRELFERPTVSQLALLIDSSKAERMNADGARPQVIPRRDRNRFTRRKTQEIDSLLAELEELSTDDAQTLLLANQPAGDDDAEAHPLSYSQTYILEMDQQEDPGVLPLATRLTGRLDKSALERCLEEICKRHEALRATIAVVDGRPSQIISKTFDLGSLPVVDLCELTEAQQEGEVHRLMRAEARRGFDMTRGPLLRVSLVRLSRTDHVALMSMSEIISDAWSLNVFMREVVELYDAFSNGRPSPLPELPIQVTDYAHWEREWLRGETLEELQGYWAKQLGGTLPRLEFPTDRSRAGKLTSRGGRESVVLDAGLVGDLKSLARQEGVTLFMLMLAAYKTLLREYTGQEDIIVGVPEAGRNWVETEPLIGSFANTLVLRSDLSGAVSFREFLGRVRDVTLGAYAHKQMPFAKLLKLLRASGAMDDRRPFRSMFDLVLGNDSMKELELPGLTVTFIEPESDSGISGAELNLVIHEVGTELVASVRYKSDLYERSTMARFVERFQTLLKAIVDDPDRELSSPSADEYVRAENLSTAGAGLEA